MRKTELPTPVEEAVRTFIRETHGRFFYVEFTKVDETLRPMVARIGVTKGVVGTGINYARAHGYITVWDAQRKEFRNVNPGRVKAIRYRNTKVVFQNETSTGK